MHIRDPIHGAIRLTPRELEVVESPVFQRLRGIRQLGFTEHAFPGATHSRFAHGLGAMEMATRMFEAIFPPGGSPLPAEERERLRQLVRLTVLLHDVGHAPLSHATEVCMPRRAALALPGDLESARDEQATHEDYTLKLLLESELTDRLRRVFGPQGIDPLDICYLLSHRYPERAATLAVEGLDYGPLLSQLVSGELDADRLDYLQRDSYYTGVSYGKVDEQWLLSNLGYQVVEGQVFLAMSHRGIFAFEDFLLSRYHMFVSVYYHHSSVGFDNMLMRYLEDAEGELAIPTDVEAYLAFDDVAFWSVLRRSKNVWAERMVRRQLYRRILELNAETGYDLTALLDALTAAGVDHFVARDEGVLSRYYGNGRAALPIFVINRPLGWATPVEAYSKLYERYAQPARLTRVYSRPDQVPQAQECLRRVVAG
ncbi:MAG: HD domain-containing protein [Deltaproteobacteria bacterium]|nr:HD domain-containing protein [Deltaproteobacteria bacterium]